MLCVRACGYSRVFCVRACGYSRVFCVRASLEKFLERFVKSYHDLSRLTKLHLTRLALVLPSLIKTYQA